MPYPKLQQPQTWRAAFHHLFLMRHPQDPGFHPAKLTKVYGAEQNLMSGAEQKLIISACVRFLMQPVQTLFHPEMEEAVP